MKGAQSPGLIWSGKARFSSEQIRHEKGRPRYSHTTRSALTFNAHRESFVARSNASLTSCLTSAWKGAYFRNVESLPSRFVFASSRFSTRASCVLIDVDEFASGTVTYCQPSFGWRMRLRFIHVFGVYCVTSKTIHSSTAAIRAKCPRYGKKYGCMMPSFTNALRRH